MYCRECGAEVGQAAKYCERCGSPVALSTDSLDHAVPEGLPVPPPGIVADPILAERPRATAKTTTRRGRTPALTLALVFLFIAVAVVLEVFGYLIGMGLGTDAAELCGTLGLGVGAALGMLALGGKRLLVANASTLGTALKKGWWLLAVSGGLCALDFVGIVQEGQFALADGWPLRLLWTFAFCLAIGFAEEGMFRGLLLGGFMDASGKSRRGLFVAVVLSSLVFGSAHVDWGTLVWTDSLQVAQALLKIVQTGMLGYFFCALVVHTRSVAGPALLHALSNFLLMMVAIGLLGQDMEPSYVYTGEDALPTVFLYLTIIVLYIPIVVIGTGMLKKAQVPDRGELHRKS